ncbi:DNA adenine methylase [Fibrella sp. WM1]|uniref:DNA adenine methylase n=1 Tax=Fibrella musci TaxID=3242485 RepID=UPI0035208BD2
MKLNTPTTRYSGSKRKLVNKIWQVIDSLGLEFTSVLDVFGGTGSFAYHAKRHGKQVIYNDIFKFNYLIGQALIENDTVELTLDELRNLFNHNYCVNYDNIIETNYKGIYYTDEENKQIDILVKNIQNLDSDSKRASAYYLLFQSCLIKRPYNLFHRKNLNLRVNFNGGRFGNKTSWETTFSELFERFYKELIQYCFSNSQENYAINQSALDCDAHAELVYIDPPYFNDNTHVTYHSRYHFLEGLANYEILEANINHSKRNKEVEINNNNDFENKHEFLNNLSALILNHNQSIIALSYRGNGFPHILSIKEVVEQYKHTVEVVDLGNYSYALNRNNNLNNEYLIIGY